MAAPNEVLIWELCCRLLSLIKLLLYGAREEGRGAVDGSSAARFLSLFHGLHLELYYVITIFFAEKCNKPFPFGAVAGRFLRCV